VGGLNESVGTIKVFYVMAQQMLTVMAEAAAQHGSSSPSQPSRQQQHATPRVKVKGRRRVKSRTSYSLSLKLKAVEEAERSGLRAAALSLQIDERVLRQWLTKAEELRQAGLTNAGSTRRLRSRSASNSKIASGVSSSPEHEVHSTVSSPPFFFKINFGCVYYSNEISNKKCLLIDRLRIQVLRRQHCRQPAA